MNKKVKTYILLGIVLGIWGTIGYQVYTKLNPDEELITTSNGMVSFTPKQHIVKDTFSISPAHHDPFLNKPYQKRRGATTGKKTTKNNKTIVFPKVVYKGVISKQKSSNNIYIIEVNGTQQLFKVGKEIDSIRLVKGTKKSVLISYKGKRKEVTIQH
ncbi:hypothetical protein [Kordia sp.]|uniref:hypothetical protein n=1 Tax=Kordia sp. TaxID=1965332 RepID=UPI003D2DB2BD